MRDDTSNTEGMEGALKDEWSLIGSIIKCMNIMQANGDVESPELRTPRVGEEAREACLEVRRIEGELEATTPRRGEEAREAASRACEGGAAPGAEAPAPRAAASIAAALAL